MKPPANSASRILHTIDWHRILGSRLAGLDRVELEQLTEALAKHSRRSLRLNPLIGDKLLPFDSQQIPWYRNGRWVMDPTVRPGAFLQHASGDYYIQDAASMLALNACRIQPHEAVCDVCAAPGGKATGLLQQLNHTGYLVANEVIKSRLHVLNSALERTGLGNYVTTSLDVAQFSELLPSRFDCVLVDAPCSGQSMVGSHKQSIAAYSEHQIHHSAARQRRILQAASRLAKPGGRLVYSTCTFAVVENEETIQHFLSLNSDWRTVEYSDLQPWGSPLLSGCYRLWPHRDDCDGAFVAILARNADGSVQLSDSPAISLPSDYTFANRIGKRDEFASKVSFNKLRLWRGKMTQLDFLNYERSELVGYSIWQFRDRLLSILDLIPRTLLPYLVSAPTIAKYHTERIVPEYFSAVAIKPSLKPNLKLELSSQQAIRYLSGESIHLDAHPPFQGWCRVEWSGRQIAWGKLLGNQLKNHLPKSLRQPNLVAN